MSMGLLTAGNESSLRNCEAKSAVDAVLDWIEDRLGHGRECRGSYWFGYRRRNELLDRLRDFGLGSEAGGFDVSRFQVDWLLLLELVLDWLGVRGHEAGPLLGAKERFERSNHVLDLLFTKLKSVKLADEPIKLGMCDFDSRQVVFAIDL